MRTGVLEAVLGELAPAPLGAVAQAELESRIVPLAAAALRAHARLPLRLRREPFEPPALRGHRRAAAELLHERLGEEEEVVQEGDDDPGSPAPRAGEGRGAG